MANTCSCTQQIHCSDFIQGMRESLDGIEQELGVVEAGHPHGDACNCDMPSTCGSVAWAVLHAAVANITAHICGHCGEEAERLMVFMHDLVNAKLGKPIQDPENFQSWCSTVHQLEAKQPPPAGSIIAQINEQLATIGMAQDAPAAFKPWRYAEGMSHASV